MQLEYERQLTLLPAMAGESQSASYAFVAIASDSIPWAEAGSSLLSLSYESTLTVQLPVALYDPAGRLRFTVAHEPARGLVRLSWNFGGEPDCIPGKGLWKLVLHKRILDETLSILLRIESDSRPIPAGTSSPEASAVGPQRPALSDTTSHAPICTCPAPDLSFEFESATPVPGPGWYSGEIHLHSNASTGRTDVATILRVAREQGLDFLALTDHFTPSHWERIEALGQAGQKPLFLRSVEVAGDSGHANLHGLSSWPNPFPDDSDGAVTAFLGFPLAGSMEAAADAVHAQGGLFCINHPLSAGAAWRYRDFPLGKADLFEVACLPDGPVSFLYPTLWDRLLCSGLHITGVGSSDSHDPLQDGPWALGRIKNRVWATSLSREGILEALREGRSCVTIGTSRLDFHALTSTHPGRIRPMGSTLDLEPDAECILEVELRDHPSGNLFATLDGFLYDVHFLPAGEGPDTIQYRIPASMIGHSAALQRSGRRESYLRVEFHEDLEKARYHGMAFRDHRSLRALSNPIWMRVVTP